MRSTLLMLAITLHNFPEGLAVGVRFGGGDVGAATALDVATLRFIAGFAVMMALDNVLG